MVDCFNWLYDKEATKKEKCQDLVYRLQEARNKLTPIIDDIIVSTVELLLKGDSKFINEQILTTEQYQDVLRTSQMLNDLNYDFEINDTKYQIPNSDVIVNNVIIDSNRGNSIIIDEDSVVELLQIYEQMGVVIQRLVTEGVRVNNVKSKDNVISATRIDSKRSTTKSRSGSSTPRSEPEMHDTSGDDADFIGESDKDINPPEIKSTLSALLNDSSSDLNKRQSERVTPRKNKENISEKNEYFPTSKDDLKNNQPTVFIRIQCFSDCSDQEGNGPVINCAKNCPSQYHVKLGGEPVTLKMDQNNVKDGAVYCINTGQDDDGHEIKVIIKQCPECMSTIIGSSTKITDVLQGESHESITLHGKQGDESKMTLSSSDEGDLCQCSRKGETCIDLSKVTCDQLKTPCPCYRGRKPKMGIVIDADNVDKSSVHVYSPSEEGIGSPQREQSPKSSIHDTQKPKSSIYEESEPEQLDEEKSKHSIYEGSEEKQPHDKEKTKSITIKESDSKHLHDKEEQKIKKTKQPETKKPLTRRKICSSMEFDVTKVPTRLRDHEIEHRNAHVVVELKKLGVDQILRACRPAKCCRKAILNERQRTALPYCVSLKSLPLMGNDVEVIKQSIDMSVKKIKNSLDLSQAYKDKLAFYVSLGRDDMRPNSNWVIPVYDLKLGQGPSRAYQNRFFILKNRAIVPKQLESVARLIGSIKTEDKRSDNNSLVTQSSSNYIRQKKYFILRKPITVHAPTSQESEVEEIRHKINRRKRKSKIRKIEFKQQEEFDSQGIRSFRTDIKTLKSKQFRSTCKRKNIWSSISHEDWRLVLSQEHQHLNLGCDEAQIEKINVECSNNSTSTISSCGNSAVSHFPNVCSCQQPIFPNPTVTLPVATTNREGGDYSFLSSNKLREAHLKKLVKECKTSKTSELMLCTDRRLPRPKSMPALFNHVSNTWDGQKIIDNNKLQCSKKLWAATLTPKTLKTEEGHCQLSKNEKNHSKPLRKQLEYYVGLVDGDLVWSQTLPLLPQNYDTYFHYVNKNKEHDIPPDRFSVEDQMVATRVTTGESQRTTPNVNQETNSNMLNYTQDRRDTASETDNELDRQRTPVEDPMVATRVSTDAKQGRRLSPVANQPPNYQPYTEKRRSTISEIPEEELAHLQNKIYQPAEKSKLPPKYSSFSMGPESADEPWAPHVVSETSLPRIQEVVKKVEIAELEAVPVPVPEEKPVKDPPKPASPCASKQVCAKSKCTDCKATRCKSSKKCRPQDITISIKKVANKGICVEATTPKSCTKEVCEIYKNKNLVSAKSGSSKGKDEKCEKFTINAEDNIEIYIKNDKICMANKDKKFAKEAKGEKKKLK